MKRLVFTAAACVAAPFVGMAAAAADIHPTASAECVEGQVVQSSTWVNPFGMTATVTIAGDTFTVPPFSTVTAAGAGPFTVTFEGVEGYEQTGTLEPVILYEGCTSVPSTTIGEPPTTLPPCPERVNGPTCPTIPPPSEPCRDVVNGPTCNRYDYTTPPPAAESSGNVEAPPPPEQPHLAFTGSARTELLILAAGAFIGSGATLTWATRRRS